MISHLTFIVYHRTKGLFYRKFFHVEASTPVFRNLRGLKWLGQRSGNIGNILVLKLLRIVDDIISYRTDTDSSSLHLFVFHFLLHFSVSSFALIKNISSKQFAKYCSYFPKKRAKTLITSMKTCNNALICTEF